MVAKGKGTSKAASLSAGIVIGVLVALLITFAGCAIMAYLVSEETAGIQMMTVAGIVITILAAALGAITACAKTKRMRIQVSFLTGAVYFLVLLAVTAMVFDGQYEGIGKTVLCILGGCSAAALIGLKQGGRANGKRRKMSYR